MAARRAVPLETSFCLILLGMPEGLLVVQPVVALKPWKQVQLYLLPCFIIRTRVHVMDLLLGSVAVR